MRRAGPEHSRQDRPEQGEIDGTSWQLKYVGKLDSRLARAGLPEEASPAVAFLSRWIPLPLAKPHSRL